MVFIPLIIILFNLRKSEKIKNKIIKNIDIRKIYIFISLPILNLFLMGLDWGRWSNIFYFYSITSLLYLIHKEYFYFDENRIVTFIKSKFGKQKINLFALTIFIIFAFTWNLKATFKEDIGSLPIYRMPAKTIKVLLNI